MTGSRTMRGLRVARLAGWLRLAWLRRTACRETALSRRANCVRRGRVSWSRTGSNAGARDVSRREFSSPFAVRRSIFDAQAQHAPIAAPKKKRLAIFASRFPCRPIEAEPASRIRPAASPRQAG
ncbi:hypothetical protein DR62_06235 [Burkholderia thailandensis]|uniref:Uncharacterized protein n=1 Tax=Burkholderia thailandensis TaxID=57975 RepID=A0AAW9D6J1_BURTH|nr:hypothetical protein DR62_06235 [Burkholderia thailandensis]AOI53029.1 hypothetical protein WI24_15250 [Burkholderia thailandensis]AOJ52039.1 hypothetical protein AQ475_15225 [Burkholderia thailandensis]AVR24388.1 hypothetical protein A8H32_03955 [Burkholderia thailandensis]MDW9238306.1 hypothetical protein [Burkholderia thailandensis]